MIDPHTDSSGLFTPARSDCGTTTFVLVALASALCACSGNAVQPGSAGAGGSNAEAGLSGFGGAGLPSGGFGPGGSAGTPSASGSGGSPLLGGAGGLPSSAGLGGSDAAGAPAMGGASAGGGAGAAAGGAQQTGGSGSAGSNVGGAAGATAITAPCDIYKTNGTPCVAAHSTARAVYGAYAGKLYQVRRASDKTTKDIAVESPGGYASSATQDTFCAGTTCTISIIYDQSPQGNDLKVTPAGGWLANGGTEAKATAAKITINGHAVYGVYTTGSFDAAVGGVGYRNNSAKGTATGDQPEAIYAVVSGKHYNQWCCFDYGNAETNNKDNGAATMEALYFGNSTQWGKGSGAGPWVMADLEDGLFAGQSFAAPATNTPIASDYVTGMVKGKPGTFALKGGSAQSGTLKALYQGPYPSGYSPMKKEGAIVLGVGGDNSHTGEGTFFEGCMTAGFPSDATDDAVQANVVAAGYGR